jgi:large subunit ribosomal protein L24e
MAKCSFCSKQIEQGHGVTFVDMYKIYNFCSSKCLKNFRLGRDSKKLAWVRKAGKKKTKVELKAELLEEAKHKKEEKVERKAEEKSEETKEAKPKTEEKVQEKPKTEKPSESK